MLLTRYRYTLILALLALPVHAQLNRTAVSVQGSDLNTCAVNSPCRNFSAAHAQTNPGGEIVVLDSGGFGTFTINKAISVVAAPGVYAGITVPSSHGISVSVGATDEVVIRGVSITAIGNANGIVIFSGGSVSIERFIMNGGGWGVAHFGGRLTVTDSTIRNASSAIYSSTVTPGPWVVVERVVVMNSVDGPIAFWSGSGTHLSIRDSIATGGDTGFYAGGSATPSFMNIENCVATHLDYGVSAGETSTVRISNSVVTANNVGLKIYGAGVIETFGNNQIRANNFDLAGTPTVVPQN